MDRIKSEVYRDELNVESIEVTKQRGQLTWRGLVTRMGEERLDRKKYKVKEDEKRKGGKPRKTWMEEVRKACEARGENGRTQGKCVKTEKNGNNYGGEIHETQLRTTLHLTVT